MTVGDKVVKEGDWLSIDGFTGEVIVGQLETRPSEVLQVLLEGTLKPEDSQTYKYYDDMMKWADAERRLLVRANADQPDQSANAIKFGAEGIGLCRTEHMFFGGERITAVREMILADTVADREKALAKLLPMQRDDFAGIFRGDGRAPGDDPHARPAAARVPAARRTRSSSRGRRGAWASRRTSSRAKVEELHETNPMLGHRGCRLGIAYPRDHGDAGARHPRGRLRRQEGGRGRPARDHDPARRHARRSSRTRRPIVRRVAAEVFAEQGVEVDYLVGTMIEMPRAALTADKIAEVAEFFSFGTNDLTQMTFGVQPRRRRQVPPAVPRGAGDLAGRPVRDARPGGRRPAGRDGHRARPRARGRTCKVGICGEHGGDPESVKFCHRAGLDYVSCSPFRVPVARLAAAQAAIEERGDLRLEK